MKGERVSSATGVTARVGPIVAESNVEVLQYERDKYRYVTDLCFSSKRYSVRADGSRNIVVLAPFPSVIAALTPLEFGCSNSEFKISGERELVPKPELGIALCKLRVRTASPERQRSPLATPH